MFGSNSFRKPRFSPFGAQPAFGQQNTATNNSSAARPFGRTSPFGAQTESTLFGGNSTGIFGATPSPSPLATSTPIFGSSSTPAFGPTFGFSSTPAFDATSTPAYGATSTPAFGASSAPAFGSSSSLFGATSVFGQKPAFGGFGSPNPAQSSLFGSNFGQTQPASGSQPFGATSQSALGSTSTPAFGSTSTPAFGATSTPTFGTRSTPAFGASSTPAFGANSTQAFGASSTPSFGFGSTPTFSQSASAFGTVSTPAFGSSPSFGSTPSPFGAQNSAFGVQSTTTFGCPDFGQTPFGGQRGGSRVAPYTTTNETDSSSSISGQTTASGKLLSISAMPQYKEKSHEELRWEDYQLGNKGGPIPASQLPTGGLFSQPTQASPFGQRTPSAFGQITTSAFGQTTSAFGQAAAANSFSSTFPDIFRNRATGFGSMPFGSRVAPYTTTNETDSSSSVSGQTTTPVELLSISAMPQYKEKSHEELRWEDYQSGDKSGTNTASKLPAGGLFSQPTQSSPFGQTTSSAFWQTTPSAFGRTTSAFGQASTVNPFCSTSPGIFGNRATGFGSTPFGSSSGGLNPASQLPAGGLFSQPTQSSPFGQTTPSAFWQTAPSAFGQTTSALSQAAAADPFSSTFPDIFQNRATGFGSMPFGSRVAPYTTTNETDSSSSVSGQTTTAGELLSISAMPQYKEKSHEELRWEDYQLRDKGGTNPASQLPAGGLFSQPTQSSPFGQTTPSVFWQTTPSAFGQTISAFEQASTVNPFCSTSPRIFGNRVTGIGNTPFVSSSGGTNSASQLPASGLFSQPTQSSPFGQTTPSAFGQTTSAFGQTSTANPFSSTSPGIFGNRATGFCSTPFGSSSGELNPASQLPAGGLFSQPTQSSPFGQTTSSAFWQTTPSAFDQTTSAFGQESTVNPFCSTSPGIFGNRATGFGSTPFGSSSGGLNPASQLPAGGLFSQPTQSSPFGQTTPSAFWQTAPSAFGQTTSAFAQAAAADPFSSTFPDIFRNRATGFGSMPFGSRVAPYTTTNETDSSSSVSGQTTTAGELLSISAMPQYKEKSHEELRWEDYQSSDKGGTNPASQLPAGGLFSQPTQSSPFGQTTPSVFWQTTPSAFGQTISAFEQASTVNPFCSTSPGIFGNRATGIGNTPFVSSSGGTNSASQLPASGLFSQPTQSSPFGQTTPSAFGRTTPAFGQTSTANPFSSTSPGIFGNRATGFCSTPFGSSSGKLNPASQLPAGGLFSQPTQSSPFGQTTPYAFGQTTSAFGQTSTANPFSSTSSGIFGNRATGFGSTPFGSSSGAAFKSPFAATSVSSSLFGSSTPPAFGGASSASPCGTSSSPAFNSTPFGQAPQPGSLFGSTPSLGSSPVFGSSTPFRNTQSTGLFQSSTPAFGQTTPFFGQSTPAFSQSTPAFGRTTNVFGQITPAFGSKLFSNGTTSMMSQSNPAGLTQSMPSLFGGFQNPTTTQTQGGSFSLSNFGQPQATGGEMEASNYQISKMALGKQTREVEKENMKSAMTSIFQRMDKDKEIKEQLKEKMEQLTPMSALPFVNIDDKDMPPAGEIGCIVKATKSWMEDLVALGSKLINEAFILYHKIHDELNSLADMKKKFDEELQELKWSLPQIEEMTKIDFDILVAEEIFDGSSPSLHIEWLEAAKWRIEILEEGKTRFKEVDGISHDALIDIQDFIEKIPCDFYDDQRSINSVGVLKDQLAKVIKEELSGFDVAYIDRLVKLKILCRDFEKKLINSRRVPSKVLSTRISRDMRFRYSKGLNQEAVKEAIDKFRQHQKRVCSSEKGTINIEDSQGDGSH